jgi:hypothetical protein
MSEGFWQWCATISMIIIFHIGHHPQFHQDTLFQELDLFPSSSKRGKIPIQLGATETASIIDLRSENLSCYT